MDEEIYKAYLSGGYHWGRSWEGHPLEDECPCDQGPCGLAISSSVPDCPQHGFEASKTMRQGHLAEMCPGKTEV